MGFSYIGLIRFMNRAQQITLQQNPQNLGFCGEKHRVQLLQIIVLHLRPLIPTLHHEQVRPTTGFEEVSLVLDFTSLQFIIIIFVAFKFLLHLIDINFFFVHFFAGTWTNSFKVSYFLLIVRIFLVWHQIGFS